MDQSLLGWQRRAEWPTQVAVAQASNRGGTYAQPALKAFYRFTEQQQRWAATSTSLSGPPPPLRCAIRLAQRWSEVPPWRRASPLTAGRGRDDRLTKWTAWFGQRQVRNSSAKISRRDYWRSGHRATVILHAILHPFGIGGQLWYAPR